MSAKLMGLCYNLQIKRGQRTVLLALADHANDAGFCWPSIGLIAWKTGYSERQVQRLIRQLELVEIVAIEDGATGGRNVTPTYQIDLDILYGRTRPDLQKTPRERTGKGDKMSRFCTPGYGYYVDTSGESSGTAVLDYEKGDTSQRKGDTVDQKGDISDVKGDAIMSPEPSDRTIIEPSEKPSGRSLPETDQQCVGDGDCKGKGDSDSLRSSGASLRSDAAAADFQTEERFEKAKRRYAQFKQPSTQQMMVDSELGADSEARAKFEEWRAEQEQGSALKATA